MTQLVKNLPATWETWVWSLGWEDPLKKGKAGYLLQYSWASLVAQTVNTICFTDFTRTFDCVDHDKLWKTLKEMGIPDHLTYILRNLYVGQEATIPCMEQLIVSRLRKEYNRSVCCHPVCLTYMLSTSWEMLGWVTSWNQDRWEKHQQPQICRWYHFNGRKWRGTKEPLDEGEGGAWKSWLKTKH